MRLPALSGVIDRRILVNYRVEPAVLAPTSVPAQSSSGIRYRRHLLDPAARSAAPLLARLAGLLLGERRAPDRG
jgi:hypothetical protein